jgi:hypothetical protein
MKKHAFFGIKAIEIVKKMITVFGSAEEGSNQLIIYFN